MPAPPCQTPRLNCVCSKLWSTMTTLFPTASDDDEMMIGVYERQGRTLDDLPYTDAFEQIAAAVTDGEVTQARRAEVFHRLHNLRKAGRMPRLGRAASQPPRIDREQERRLEQAVVDAVGSLGQRDQLPYTPALDAIVDAFNADTGLALAHHDVWRLIAKLAK